MLFYNLYNFSKSYKNEKPAIMSVAVL